MGFHNKNKNKHNRNVQAAAMKPSEQLSSVLSESVPSASLDIIRSNTEFKLRRAEESYIIMAIHTEDIGGLNRHMKADADKGQFIECIAAGNIDVHADTESVEHNVFSIIPTEKSLRTIEEFSFLTNSAIFSRFIPTLVTVDRNGNMDFQMFEKHPVSYDWLVKVHRGEVDINEMVADFEELSGSIQEESTDTEVSESVIEGEDEDMDETYDAPTDVDSEYEESSYGDTGSSDNDTEPDFGEEEAPVSEQEESAPAESFTTSQVLCPNCKNAMMYMNDACPSCGYRFDGMDESDESDTEEETQAEPEKEPEDMEISEDEVKEAIERIFYAGDLDLQISPKPFDMQFLKENSFTPIPENRGDGWLDGYVTQIVKNANVALSSLHRRNLFLSRERYLKLITAQCEDIAKQVDLSDSSNRFAAAKQIIVKDTDDKRREMDVTVEKQRTDLQKRWDEELNTVMQSAAEGARRSYVDKFSKAHEMALRDVETHMRDEIDMEYNQAMTDLNKKRKAEAKRLLDIAITQTLIEMSDSYKEMLSEEDKVREELMQEIQDYIDDHRKEEVARTQVLSDEMKAQTEAEKVAMEMNRRIQSMTADYEAVCDKLKQDVAAAQTHEETIKSDYANRLSAEQARNEALTNKLDIMTEKYANIDRTVRSEYAERINTLTNEKKAAEEHLAHVDKIHNKYDKISITIWVAIAIATFCIGAVVGGKFFNSASNPFNGQFSISLTSPKGQTQEVQEPSTEADAVPETETEAQ